MISPTVLLDLANLHIADLAADRRGYPRYYDGSVEFATDPAPFVEPGPSVFSRIGHRLAAIVDHLMAERDPHDVLFTATHGGGH